MNLGLEGRIVLITGGSRGIGRAAALAFGRERARVAVTYNSDRARAEAVVAELRASDAEGMAVSLSLGDHASIRAAVLAVVERWQRVDALVNNAVEWGPRGPWEAPAFEDDDPAYWQPLLQANTAGHYRAIQCVLPGMRAQGWGRIVNVSSSIAIDGMPGAGHYGAAKAALHGLTRTLAKELGPAGILTNVVMPGLTLTEHVKERIPAEARDEVARAAPIRRLLPPEEVVPTIVFLSSAANTAVTGEVIRASGGAT
jgi:3-oxoacyl-[acyl-carrier protein] reductase